MLPHLKQWSHLSVSSLHNLHLLADFPFLSVELPSLVFCLMFPFNRATSASNLLRSLLKVSSLLLSDSTVNWLTLVNFDFLSFSLVVIEFRVAISACLSHPPFSVYFQNYYNSTDVGS